jgi:spermidine synthase
MAAAVNLEPRGRHYLAVFLLSCCVLMLEIAVARILSVALLSHYAFVAISLAMFGLGVSALVVFLLPGHFTPERLDEQLVAYGWRFALSAVLSLVVFLHIEVVQELSLSGALTLTFAYLILALPYFFAGVCLALLMTHFAAHIGRIYSYDLVGASLGCVGVVAAMSVAPAPYVVAYVAAVIAAVALWGALTMTPRRLVGPLAAVVVVVAVVALGHGSTLLTMRYIKGWTSFYSAYEGWNAFSRVAIFPSQLNAAQLVPLMGAIESYTDPAIPKAMIIDIDGAAWTPMLQFDGDLQKYDFLRETVMYTAHHLRPNANVLIIGTGGGRDLLAAKVFAQPSVLGIEINPLMTHIVQNVFGDYSGRPYTLPGVEVITDEARSRLSTMPQRFDIIQLSLIDTFSLNAAGGFVFSENYLYTQQAFQEYFRHLTDDGILTISRYFMAAYPLEILRVAAMVRAAWAAEGVEHPGAHVVVLAQGNTATVLAKRSAWTADELTRLAAVSGEHGMQIPYRPDVPAEAIPDLNAVLTTADLPGYLAAYPFHIAAPTDDQPFFFHFLRGRLAAADVASVFDDPFQFMRKWHEAVLLLYLLIAVVASLALAFFFGPLLALRRRSTGVGVTTAVPLLAYFGCLGYGFMMIEVPLLQHFILFLGYPVYALAVVLFALLLFSGIGSLLSARLTDKAPSALVWVLSTIIVLACIYVYAVPAVIAALIGAPIWIRILTAVGVLAPIGLVLGMAYPLGITVLRDFSAELVPWAWGLNGALSVVASVLAIFIGSRAGFTVAFLTGVAAYAVALLAMGLAITLRRSVATVEDVAPSRSAAANY